MIALTLLCATLAIAQELPPLVGGNAAVVSAEEALRQGAPPSATDHAFRISRLELSLDQDESGQWHPGKPGDWRFRGTGGEVLLELFPGEVLWLRGTGIEDAEEASSWIAEVLLPEPGVAIITRSKDGIYGTFDVGNRRYALASGSGQSRHAFAKQVDSRDIGICLTGGAHGDYEHHKHYKPLTHGPSWASKAAMQKSGGANTNLDILFLYTPGAASYMGSSATFINNLVASLNTAFSSSGVTGSARAVYYGMQTGVSALDTEDDFKDMLYAMYINDSPFTALKATRNAHAADLIVLLTERTTPSELCGAAGGRDEYPFREFDFFLPEKEEKAYAIVAVNCADNDRTFHHELGHLLGGWHDEVFMEWDGHATVTPCGTDNMSCGYTDLANEFRTIMGSYKDIGFDCTIYDCPRLLRFSDYAQTVWANGGWRALGQPKGIRAGYENFVGTLNGEGSKQATIMWVADFKSPGGIVPSAPTALDVDNCYSQHIISWSGATGTAGWYEVQSSPNASYVSLPWTSIGAKDPYFSSIPVRHPSACAYELAMP